jgi:hypothetical protein
VQSLDLSIAVNVWSISSQNNLMQSMVGVHGTPNEVARTMQWSTEQLYYGTQLFLDALVEQVAKQRTQRAAATTTTTPTKTSTDTNFLSNLFEQRFRTLIRLRQLPDGISLPRFCNETDLVITDESLNETGDGATQQQQRQQLSKTALAERLFGGALKELTTIAFRIPDDSRDVWLGNYVEYTLFTVLNRADWIGAFLQQCHVPQEEQP